MCCWVLLLAVRLWNLIGGGGGGRGREGGVRNVGSGRERKIKEGGAGWQ